MLAVLPSGRWLMEDAERRARAWRYGPPDPDITPEDRFRCRVWIADGGCWLWAGGLNSDQRGALSIGGFKILAARYAYEMYVGAIPAGLVVRHKCDNPPCCNPSHLETGTKKDNSTDALRRERKPTWWWPRSDTGSRPDIRITARRAAALEYMRDVTRRTGTPPTYRDIGKFLGVCDGSVRDHIVALRRAGALVEIAALVRSVREVSP